MIKTPLKNIKTLKCFDSDDNEYIINNLTPVEVNHIIRYWESTKYQYPDGQMLRFIKRLFPDRITIIKK